MNATHKAEIADQQAGLKQRAHASRRSVERAMQPAPEVLGNSAPAICAAARLGELLEEAWEDQARLDDVTTEENISALEPLNRHCAQQIDELELAVSYARAVTPAGMLTQLAVAFDALDLATTGTQKLAREAAAARAARCLHSVAAALCEMTRINRSGYCADRYMPVEDDKLASLSPKVVR